MRLSVGAWPRSARCDGRMKVRISWRRCGFMNSMENCDQGRFPPPATAKASARSQVGRVSNAQGSVAPTLARSLSNVAGRLKWRLWHGRSAQVVEGLKSILRMTQRPSLLEKPIVNFVRKLTRDLIGYLQNNADSLLDYGKRYRSGQRISTAFVESTVNQLIDKRMSKSQQIRWDPQSAHQLLQVRVRVVDGQLRDDFSNWYPGFPQNDSELRLTA